MLELLKHTDDVDDLAKLLDEIKDVKQLAKELENADGSTKLLEQLNKVNDAANLTKPNQLHHFLTNKNSVFTKQFESITQKYGLNLDGVWNKELMPHLGRHPNAYHDFMLQELKSIDTLANGNVNVFMKEFNQLKQTIINNPEMLTKAYWQ